MFLRLPLLLRGPQFQWRVQSISCVTDTAISKMNKLWPSTNRLLHSNHTKHFVTKSRRLAAAAAEAATFEGWGTFKYSPLSFTPLWKMRDKRQSQESSAHSSQKSFGKVGQNSVYVSKLTGLMLTRVSPVCAWGNTLRSTWNGSIRNQFSRFYNQRLLQKLRTFIYTVLIEFVKSCTF